MHYDAYKRRRFIRWLLISLSSLLLAACSTEPAPSEAGPPNEITNVASIAIDKDISQVEVEAIYGGSVITFKPDAGFAILGFTEQQAAMTTLATDPNQDTFSSPEVSAAGFDAWAGGWDAWAGGWDAWAGGWDAWAGGWDAWAGGWDAWAGGSSQSGPGSNANAFGLMKLKEAHALSRAYGQGVTVAVIDSGFDLAHPMFEGRLAPSAYWKDYVDNDSYPQEVSGGNGYGHGTGVGGIIAQTAPEAKLLPLRVLDQHGKGDLDDVISAVDWAIAKGAKIINISLGSTEYSWPLQQMMQYAASQNVYIVASSGNSGTQAMTYPARMSAWDDNKNVISVGSVDDSGRMSSFTAYGDTLFINAPGEKIRSAYPGNKTAKYTGTSFAAPQVSGALALAYADASSSANKNAFWDYLISSVDTSNNAANKLAKGVTWGVGYGRLDTEKLLRKTPGFSEPVYQLVSERSGKCVDLDNRSNNVVQYSCNSYDDKKWKFIPVGDAVKIESYASGNVLDVQGASTANDANIMQWGFHGGNNQLWYVRSVGASFEIINKHSGKCLDVDRGSYDNNANIEQNGCSGASRQLWNFRRLN